MQRDNILEQQTVTRTIIQQSALACKKANRTSWFRRAQGRATLTGRWKRAVIGGNAGQRSGSGMVLGPFSPVSRSVQDVLKRSANQGIGAIDRREHSDQQHHSQYESPRTLKEVQHCPDR